METLEKVGAKVNFNLEQLIVPYHITGNDVKLNGLKILSPNRSMLLVSFKKMNHFQLIIPFFLKKLKRLKRETCHMNILGSWATIWQMVKMRLFLQQRRPIRWPLWIAWPFQLFASHLVKKKIIFCFFFLLNEPLGGIPLSHFNPIQVLLICH